MELVDKLKLAFKAGKVYEQNWSDLHGYNDRFSFENWLEKNKTELMNK